MDKKFVYLDNNATTKIDERVLEKMLPYLKEIYSNPSSMYNFSVSSKKAIENAREQMRDFFNAKNTNEIYFTASGSEGANTAIKGVLAHDKTKKHIITTKVEHACVLNLYNQLEKQGYNVDNIVYNLVDNSVDKIGKMNNSGENKQVMPPHFARIRLKGHPSERSEDKI